MVYIHYTYHFLKIEISVYTI